MVAEEVEAATAEPTAEAEAVGGRGERADSAGRRGSSRRARHARKRRPRKLPPKSPAEEAAAEQADATDEGESRPSPAEGADDVAPPSAKIRRRLQRRAENGHSSRRAG